MRGQLLPADQAGQKPATYLVKAIRNATGHPVDFMNKREASDSPVQTASKVCKRMQFGSDDGQAGKDRRNRSSKGAGGSSDEGEMMEYDAAAEIAEDLATLSQRFGEFRKRAFAHAASLDPDGQRCMKALYKEFNQLHEDCDMLAGKHDRAQGPWVQPQTRHSTRPKAPEPEPAASKPNCSSKSPQEPTCSNSGPSSSSPAAAAVADGKKPAPAKPTPQHCDPGWLKRAQHKDQSKQQAKRTSRILRGPLEEVACKAGMVVDMEADVSTPAARTAQVMDAVKLILHKVGASDAAEAVESVKCLGYGYSTVRIVFTSAAVIQRTQRAIKQGLKDLCAGMPARSAMYLDEDLTHLQQSIRTARRPTYDYLRSQHRAGKLQGALAVSMVGCSIMLLRRGTEGQQRWTPYEGQWYSSALGTSPSPNEQHPYVRVGRAAQRAQ